MSNIYVLDYGKKDVQVIHFMPKNFKINVFKYNSGNVQYGFSHLAVWMGRIKSVCTASLINVTEGNNKNLFKNQLII